MPRDSDSPVATSASSFRSPQQPSKSQHDRESSSPTCAIRPQQQPVAPKAKPSDVVTPNDRLEHGSLEWHADANIKKLAAPNKTKAKAIWAAIDRYRSEANSFPDYGSRESGSAMASKLRKPENLNSLRPVNTLGRGALGEHTRHKEAAVGSERPAKRPRQEQYRKDSATLSPIRSPYFNAEPAATDPDIWEIGSTSDISNSATRKGISEYRSSQSRVNVKGRNRGTRSKQSFKTASPAHDVGATEIVDDGDVADNIKGGSPDVLSIDGPPPSNIISDVIKPQRVAKSGSHQSGPFFKKKLGLSKPEAIDTSEDELVVDRPQKRTNFNGIDSRQKSQVKCRGDIPTTSFPTSRESNKHNDKGLALPLEFAVGGPHWYDSNNEKADQVKLCAMSDDSRKLEPQRNGTQIPDLAWLQVNLTTLRKVEHDAKLDEHVVIERPKEGTHPSKLFLRFRHREDAAHFVELVPSHVRSLSSHIDIQKKVKHAYDMAVENSGCKQVPQRQLDSGHAEPFVPRGGSSDTAEESGPRRKIKDTMLQSHKKYTLDHAAELDFVPKRTRQGAETRRTPRTVTEPRMQDVQKWTENHPDWSASWGKSLVFPATGKSRTIVDADDIQRLDNGEFLNDNLISFYIRNLQVQMERDRPELLERIYIFNTFFFDKLRSNSSRGRVNYDGVKAWTAKVDIFSYDYIVVPVNENAHWYLAIVCNVPNTLCRQDPTSSMTIEEDDVQLIETRDQPKISKLDRNTSSSSPKAGSPQLGSIKDSTAYSDLPSSPRASSNATPTPRKSFRSFGLGQKLDPKQPRIVTLDSFGSPHSPTCTALREYLILEAKHRKGVDLSVIPAGMTAKGIPGQDNYWDCGVFVLGYMAHFLRDPDATVAKLLQKQDTGWDINPSKLRTDIRELLFKLQEEQKSRLAAELREKRMKKAADKERLRQSEPASSSPAPKTSSHGEITTLKDEQTALKNYGPQFVEQKPTSSPVASLTTELGLVKPLEDSSQEIEPSEVVPVDKPTDTIRRPRSLGKMVVEIKAPSVQNDKVRGLDEDSPHFVRPLSSSPAPQERDHSRKDRESSVVEVSRKRRRSPGSLINQISVDIKPSIEQDGDVFMRSGAKYDGIQN